MVEDRMLEIPQSIYIGLLRDSLELQALEGAGVDNWPGYEEVDYDSIDAEIETEISKIQAEADNSMATDDIIGDIDEEPLEMDDEKEPLERDSD